MGIIPVHSAPTVLILIHLGVLLLTAFFAFLADVHSHTRRDNWAVIENMKAVRLVESKDLSSEFQLVVAELAHVGIGLICSIQCILNLVDLAFQFNHWILNLCGQ